MSPSSDQDHDSVTLEYVRLREMAAARDSLSMLDRDWTFALQQPKNVGELLLKASILDWLHFNGHAMHSDFCLILLTSDSVLCSFWPQGSTKREVASLDSRVSAAEIQLGISPSTPWPSTAGAYKDALKRLGEQEVFR